MRDILENQQKAAQADCQSENIERGIRLSFVEIAQGDFEVVFEHSKVRSLLSEVRSLRADG
jgi:hypothetical protein